MRISSLLGYLGEVRERNTLPDETGVIALKRNPDEDLESDGAWSSVPVVELEVDEPDLDLVVDSSGAREPMQLGEFASRLGELVAKGDDLEIFVQGESRPVRDEWWVRKDIPAVGPVFNPVLNLFGVMMWYEGFDQDFPE